MFIEKIIITNFRSFENGRIENLSVGQNVFVGPNGSGKSNIVLALEFVLTKNYHHLTGKQKNLLICQHQLSKQTVIEASVEIHLNNMDGHFPLPEKSIVIKRQISANYDHHFVNGGRVKMVEVMRLLESGGFSPENSYYLVKQGLIGEIAVSDARYRLEILRSISGAKSFDEKRAKSLEMIKESEQLLVQYEKLIKAIQFDLSLLKVDEAKMKQYENLCKMKKYVLLRIKQNRLGDRQSCLEKVQKEIDKLSKQLNADQKELADLQKKLNEVRSRLENTVGQIGHLQTQFESCKSLMESLPRPSSDLHQQQASSMDRDVQEDWCRIGSLQEQLQKAIDDHSSDKLELSQMIEREEECKHQMECLLNKKLNYHNLVSLLQSTHTTQQRNQLIMDKFIKVSDQNLEETRRTLVECENNLRILKTEKTEIEKLIKLGEQKPQAEIDEIESLNKEITHLVCQNKLNEVNFSKVMNELNLLQKESLNVENELKKLENWLDLHTSGMAISSKRSINTLLDSLQSSLDNNADLDPEEQERTKRLIDGYYGQLVDCFEMTKPVDYAMEVLMKNNIFYHVVQDEHIAVQLLDKISQQKLTGSFRMVAVDRVASSTLQAADAHQIDCGDGQALYSCIKNRQPNVAAVEIALNSLFKGLFIARSFSACWRLFQNNQDCDFATLDGESIDRFGVVSRISMVKPTKLQMYNRWLDHKQRLDEIKQKMREAEVKRDRLLEEKSLTNRQLAVKREKLSSLQEDWLKSGEKLGRSDNLSLVLDKIEQQIKSVRSELQNSQSRMSCLVEEQNFWQLKLTQERLDLDLEPLVCELTEQIDGLREKLQLNSKHRNMLETRVRLGQTNINDLKTKLNQLKYKISNQTWSEEQARKVQELEMELSARRESAEKQICLINAQIIELNQVKSELESDLERLKEKHEKCFNKCDSVRKRLQLKQEQFRKMEAEFEMIRLEIETTTPLHWNEIDNEFNLRNLDQMNLDQLNVALKNLNGKMKLLDEDGGHVNRETLRCFRELCKNLDRFNKAKKQQMDHVAQIRNMIRMIEHRKDEFVLRTYKQVNYHFQRIFQQFVPNGYGCLQFLTAAAPSDSSMEGSVDSYQSDEFKGIEILVSFTNRTGPDTDLMSLSGGQRALVSLALIFSLQRVDPMPFYVFDEVDQSLDQTHRMMVAQMIRKLVTEQNKQFLITTFHTETVEQTDQAYAVRNINGLSQVEPITKEAALEFLSNTN